MVNYILKIKAYICILVSSVFLIYFMCKYYNQGELIFLKNQFLIFVIFSFIVFYLIGYLIYSMRKIESQNDQLIKLVNYIIEEQETKHDSLVQMNKNTRIFISDVIDRLSSKHDKKEDNS